MAKGLVLADAGISSIPSTSVRLEKILRPIGINIPSRVIRYTCLSVLRNIVPIGVKIIVLQATHPTMADTTSSLASIEAGVKSLAVNNHIESAFETIHLVANPVSVFRP